MERLSGNLIDQYNYNIDHFINVKKIVKHKKDKIARKMHLEYALSQINIEGMILEFGVASGTTINHISSIQLQNQVYGFDTFTGLPEPWNRSSNFIFNKGHFSVSALPEVNNNVTLIPGLFEDTLPKFISNNNNSVCFLHIDCDLYSSTKTVLKLLNKQIIPGTVIVFDEFYPFNDYNRHTNWENDEFKACKEWLEDFNRKIEVVSRSSKQQICVKVVK